MAATARALVIALLALASCAESGPDAAAGAAAVAPGELAALLGQADAPLLLDVRTPAEFAAGHVPGATLVPVQELEARAGELAAYRERGIVTYCEKGPRAERAGELLRAAGFQNVRVLDGSMARWREERREVATGP